MVRLMMVVVFCGLVRQGTATFNKCPKNRLTEAEFFKYIATGQTFLGIYTIEILISLNAFTKKKYYVTDFLGEFSIFQTGYYQNMSTCADFEYPVTLVTEREFRLPCLRFEKYVTSSGGGADIRFFSQEPSKYFWQFICPVGNVQSFNSCMGGDFTLNIPDIRDGEGEEIDLSGLPWHKIAEDLEDFTGRKFDDPIVKYVWMGEECTFNK